MCGIINLSFIYKSGFIFFSTQVGFSPLNPGKVNFEGLVHLLRYIRDNTNLGLWYYANIEDVPISDILIQDSINKESQLMVFYDYRWEDYPYTVRSIVEYIVFYQGRPIDHLIHVPGTVSK